MNATMIAELKYAHKKITRELIEAEIPFSFYEPQDHIYIGHRVAEISVEEIVEVLTKCGDRVSDDMRWFTITGCDELQANLMVDDGEIDIRFVFLEDE